MHHRNATSPPVPLRTLSDLNNKELMQLLEMFAGNVLVHYGMWFTESVYKLGLAQTLELESKAFRLYAPLAVKRLAPHLEALGDQHPLVSSSHKDDAELIALIQDLAKTWVASDGTWFQAVEAHAGMAAAKEINDRCWANFAALEAMKILAFLGLPQGCGLSGLQKALEFRTYSVINAHTTEFLEDGSLLLTFQECRVQDSRRRKKMQDYPCKSAGMIEYSNFAAFIDNRIATQCVYCPPDPLGPDQYCSWRFTMS
ncbi:MAG: DUF6125 family protein [Desulfomonilaceae bacterium]